jgi:DNA-binding winged helix-turn-helix (wHTH) protein
MSPPEVYKFGEFTLNVPERHLTRGTTSIPLAPKAFDILVALVRRAGRLTSKRELLKLVWPDTFVAMGVITVHVSALRQALNDTKREARYIETVSGSGYRFTAAVRRIDRASPDAIAPSPRDSDLSIKRYTQESDAYLLYLKGRYLWEQRTGDGALQAIEHFEAAIKKDPSYALAYSGLGACYGTLSFTNGFPPRDVFRKSRLAVLRALELDETLAEAHETLAGFKFWHEWDWEGAEREFRRAIDIAPDQPAPHRFFGYFLSNMGRHAEALQEAGVALELEPTSTVTHARLGQFLYQAGDYVSALKQLRHALKLDPDFWLTRFNLGRIYERSGQYAEAIKELQAAADRAKGNGEIQGALGYTLAVAGRTAEARHVFDELEQAHAGGLVYSYALALTAAGLGDRDAMFAHLRNALSDRDTGLTFLKIEPRWKPYDSAPAFREVYDRLGFSAGR